MKEDKDERSGAEMISRRAGRKEKGRRVFVPLSDAVKACLLEVAETRVTEGGDAFQFRASHSGLCCSSASQPELSGVSHVWLGKKSLFTRLFKYVYFCRIPRLMQAISADSA